MFLAIMPPPTCWGIREAQQGSKKGGAKGSGCFLKESTQSGLCISRSLSEKVYSTWTRKIGIETRRQILQRRLALNQNSGKKGSIARHYPKVCTSWAWSLRAKIRAQITWGGLDPRTMRPQSSVGFGEKIYKLKNSDKTTFYVPGEVKGMSTPITSKRPEERDFVVDSGSINAHDEQKKNQAQKNYMDCEKVLSPNSSLDCKRWRAHSRGGTSVRSWLESVRNRATTRRNASCPVARQALQRPRILLRVGQRSSTTINPKYEKYYVQDRQFCTSFRSRVICQSRKQFVFYDAITRIVGTEASPASSDLVFGRSDETSSGKLGQESWENDKKDKNDSLADMLFWLVDFTDNQSDSHRSACSSTHFSGFRFGTFYESGKEVEET